MRTKKNKIKKYSLRVVSYALIFSFVLSSVFGVVTLVGSQASAAELIEEAFKPSKANETIINLGNTKDAVGNEILRESVGVEQMAGIGCFVQGTRLTKNELETRAVQNWISLSSDQSYQDFCQNILGWDRDVPALESQAPLIVRITKFLLRITIVLSISMVIYSGIMYIIEASKGAEVKETTNNLMYIIGWVLLALMSLGLINLISSLSISSLGIQ